MKRLLVLLASAVVLLPQSAHAASYQPSWPIRMTFYYPWYPSGFDVPGTRYHPLMGRYNVEDPAVLRNHVRIMRYAGMNGSFVSWWGVDSKEDRRLPAMMRAADGTPFRWAIHYEPEGPRHPNPSVAKIQSDLNYIKSKYGNDPNYLRIGGKPVIAVWPDPADGCAMATRWKQANTMGFVVLLKRFTGYTSCAAQPHTWYQYAPALRDAPVPGNSYAVSPGFWAKWEARPRLPRDVVAFEAAVSRMIASRARFQLVTTFNEWGEGTAIEGATEWRTGNGYGQYVEVLHRRLGSR